MCQQPRSPSRLHYRGEVLKESQVGDFKLGMRERQSAKMLAEEVAGRAPALTAAAVSPDLNPHQNQLCARFPSLISQGPHLQNLMVPTQDRL